MIFQKFMTKNNNISITPIDNNEFNSNENWHPKEGVFFHNFKDKIKNKPINSELVTKETKNILSSFIQPFSEEKYSGTGCIIGYVQSGKTTSFNALSSLALDNGYDFVIVFGGRSNMLLEQNIKEFNDLYRGTECQVLNSYENPNIIKNMDFLMLEDDPFIPSKKIIIVINKHQKHIQNLTDKIKENRSIFKNCNTLIIDDEADNASLNTSQSGEDYSPIYDSIFKLRKALPKHNVAQYTATPQALLLISKNDPYSPSFVRFISAGEKYLGTKDFFVKKSYNVLAIPQSDISTDNPKLTETLSTAIYYYLIACSESRLKESIFPGKDKKVSMMIHPAHLQEVQNDFDDIIRNHFEQWRSLIKTNKDDFFKIYREYFFKAYQEIKKNSKEISSFKKIYELIPSIINKVGIYTLNAHDETDTNFSWDNVGFYNILIGGFMLDRGFVVKGLVTTYMERGTGVANSDAIQQRGRFYGYKKDHQHLIRIWLNPETKNAFESYLETENELYNNLKSFNELGKPLYEWRREFLLDPKLKACRKNIIRIDLYRNIFNQNGFLKNDYPLSYDDNYETLKNLINKFSNSFRLYRKKDDWTRETQSLIAEDLPLRQALAFIEKIVTKPGSSDRKKFSAAKILLSNLVDNKYKCSIILMGTKSINFNEFVARGRSMKSVKNKKNTKKLDLFQGKNDNINYPGARKIFSKKKKTVTIQIHKINIDSKESFALAIKIPDRKKVLIEGESLDHIYDI